MKRILALLLIVLASIAGPKPASALLITEFSDQSAFASVTEDLAIINFDTVPTESLLVGDEFAGISISARRIAVVDPTDFDPGLDVGGLNVNSQPNGISSSLFYATPGIISFDFGVDDFLISFLTPSTAAGLWIGNVGTTTPTAVAFRDTMNNIVASQNLTQFSDGLIGTGNNNRIFYGITSDIAIGSVSVFNDVNTDGILLDDVQFGSALVVQVPEPSTISLFGFGLAGLGLMGFRTMRRERALKGFEAHATRLE